MSDLKAISECLPECDPSKLTRLVQAALDQGLPAKKILDEGLMGGMEIIGGMMEREEILIPQVLTAAEMMQHTIQDLLKDQLVETDMSPFGKVVFATVAGDIHDIGKNLVIMMLESAGFEVVDMGVDVPPERIAEEIKDKQPRLLCLSALLTTTMPMIAKTIDVVKEYGLRDQIKILIGGAPLDQEFAEEVGADGYGADAGAAVKVAKSLVG